MIRCGKEQDIKVREAKGEFIPWPQFHGGQLRSNAGVSKSRLCMREQKYCGPRLSACPGLDSRRVSCLLWVGPERGPVETHDAVRRKMNGLGSCAALQLPSPDDPLRNVARLHEQGRRGVHI